MWQRHNVQFANFDMASLRLICIADTLSKAGWSWGWVATVDRNGKTIFVADAHRGDGQHFVLHAEEKLTAFLELERAICLRLLTEQI
jgi:hypothetical protein